jgi:hypothetical protein
MVRISRWDIHLGYPARYLWKLSSELIRGTYLYIAHSKDGTDRSRYLNLFELIRMRQVPDGLKLVALTVRARRGDAASERSGMGRAQDPAFDSRPFTSPGIHTLALSPATYCQRHMSVLFESFERYFPKFLTTLLTAGVPAGISGWKRGWMGGGARYDQASAVALVVAS